MLFRRLPLPFYDKLRFISILGLIEHITQAQLCCMCYFLAGISSADSITNETYMPFIVAAGASLLVLSFASGWFTDYDRKHQHRGLQISSMLVLIGILIEVIVTFTATSAGKPALVVHTRPSTYSFSFFLFSPAFTFIYFNSFRKGILLCESSVFNASIFFNLEDIES